MVLSLKLADVPSHPFAKEAFETTLWLMDGSELVCGRSVPVSLSLHFEDRTAAPASLLETEGRGSPAVGKQGSCALKLKVAEASLDHENRSFVVRATCAVDGVAVETWSEPMKVMRLKLEIEGGGVLDHDPEEQKKTKDKAAVWYKDEGGREKCIELNVSLHDGRRNLVKDRNVRLKCVLRYAASELPVTNQQVLKVWADGGGGAGAAAGVLETKRGVCRIRARIEDVSKNHQGQSFRIEVAPDVDESPADCDVAPSLTMAVSVRSKRNKRRKAQSAARDEPSPPRAKAPSESDWASPPPRSSGGDVELTDGVRGWVDGVMAALDAMEWRHLGFEKLADGVSPNTARPLYAMDNPNDLIDRLREAYERDVAPALLDGGGGARPSRKRARGALAAGEPLMPAPALSRQRTSATGVLEILDQYEDSQRGALPPAGGAFPEPLAPGLAKPSFGPRGVSSLYVGGANGDGSGSGAAAADEDPLPPFAETAESRRAEQAVATVLAKRFKPDRAGAGPLGFPAFDAAGALVGLYRENGAASTTQIVFVPRESHERLAADDAGVAEKAFKREKSKKSECVHTLAKYKTLEKLKEAVAIYHWSKEAFTNDFTF